MPSRPAAFVLAAAASLALVGCSTSAGVDPSPEAEAVASEPAWEQGATDPAPTCPPEVEPGSVTAFEGPPPTTGNGTVPGAEVAATWTSVTAAVAAALPEAVAWPEAPPAPLDSPCIADGTMSAAAGTIETTAGLWWRCQWLDALVVEAGVSWPTDLPDPVAAAAQLDAVLADPAIAPSAETIRHQLASSGDGMEPAALLSAERSQCTMRDHL